MRARGAMDNASDYGSEDSRFESWRARIFSTLQISNHRLAKITSKNVQELFVANMQVLAICFVQLKKQVKIFADRLLLTQNQSDYLR